MPAPTPPLCLLWGPPGHGVTDYGADLAAATRRLDARVRTASVGSMSEALAAVAAASVDGDSPRVHLHATDRLLGASLGEAAATVETLAAACPLTLTLHDVPQHSDGTPYPRRVAAYSRFAAAADAVVVNSRHELALVAEHLPTAGVPHVVPLGTRRAAVTSHPAAHARHAGQTASDAAQAPIDLVVLIAGYVYPGKGHEVALIAAAAAASRLRSAGHPVGRAVVRALGGSSPGHDGDVARLHERAAELGAAFEISGFLSDEAFAAALADPGIPVAAHEHVSASRSMLDWVEAGRRPLVVRSRYSEEMDVLRPGTTELFSVPELSDALAHAWREPARTRLADGQSLRPSLDDVAADYLAWWGRTGPS